MTANRLAITCLLLAGLAGCGTPQERCDARIASERAAVARLLDEVDQNLARGYGWQTSVRGWNGVSFCAGGWRSSGIGFGYGGCYGGTNTVRTRVPIDPEAEMRKREMLQSRLAALSSGRATCAVQ